MRIRLQNGFRAKSMRPFPGVGRDRDAACGESSKGHDVSSWDEVLVG